MSCTRCRLHKTCMSVKIPGRGAENPKVVFIGQAPGREEDQRKKCFVGPAGQLLKQAIDEFSLKPAYLTNAVKCFPPLDRDPKSDELAACRPYLDEELKRLKPEVIVLLGNVPLKAMLGLSGITDHSGRVIERDGQKFFPLLHPSYILRYPQNQANFENHLKELKRVLSGVESVCPVNTQKMNVKEAKKFILNNKKVSFDYETTGIDTHALGVVRCLGLSNGDVAAWVDAQEPGFKDLARCFLTSPVTKIAHNSVFERRCSRENFGVYPRRLVWDTYAMHFLLDENSSHSLDVLAGRYLDAPAYDIYHTMQEKGWTYATVPIEKLGHYCALDSYYTFKLFDRFKVDLNGDLRVLYHKIVQPLSVVVAKMEMNGVYFDAKWGKKLGEILATEMSSIHANFVADNKRVLKRVGLYPNINLNSAPQKAKFFCEGLKLPVSEKTEGGKPSMKEDVLIKYENRHPSVRQCLNWTKRFTQLNNFVQKYPRFANDKGIIRASINPCFVVSGRLSVTKPPLQAVATDPRVRGMFSSRFRNGSIATCDFKQLELRLIASESNEKNLLEVFKKGGDPHDTTAALLFGSKFTKEQRYKAKRCNFGVVYDVSGYTLSKEFNMSEEEGDRLIKEWYKLYPKIENWKETQRQLVRKNGFITSRFGRIRRLGKADNLPDWQAVAIERQAGNFPIQSAGADMTNIALIFLNELFTEYKFKSKIILQVHDSIIVDVYPGEEKNVEDAMLKVMRSDVPLQCDWLRVPIDADFSIAERWEGMKWSELKTA